MVLRGVGQSREFAGLHEVVQKGQKIFYDLLVKVDPAQCWAVVRRLRGAKHERGNVAIRGEAFFQ